MLSKLLSSISSVSAFFRNSPSSSSSSSSSTSGALNIVDDLDKLQRTLRRIQAVLRDAEEREIRDETIKLWLKELREVAYNADDVLDEYQYELRRVELEALEEASNKKRKWELNVNEHLTCVLSKLSFPEKIRRIREQFDEIANDRDKLHLREGDAVRRREDVTHRLQPTSSHVDESGIFGREEDKDKVIELLLSDENREFCVVPIVGMGGIGKTTLAQLIYNDHKIRQNFNSMAWVCVSENFDVAKLTNEIIESITGQACNLKQLNSLQDALKQKVNGKRVFIVLDDVWNERQEPWDSFRAPFIGAETVKILVTTRNDPVASIIQTVPPFRPRCLDYDQCWSLFKHRAFGGQNLDEYPSLVEIGRKIIGKCAYLPLSVKSIGSLLRYEFDEQRWMEVLESDLWDLDLARKYILPALMLSYHHLPSHLKPCFLYSSMFPKDYRFERDRLVKLWIAQGFINVPRGNRSLEDIGNNYFDELLGRSFFQLSYGSACTLHDAIHDLARSIAGGEYYAVRLEGESLPLNISKKVRHLYVEDVYGKATAEHLSFKAPSSLRTLIVQQPVYGWPLKSKPPHFW